MLKVCLHVSSPSPSPSLSPSKFNIVLMVTGTLTGRMGFRPITISTMLTLTVTNTASECINRP